MLASTQTVARADWQFADDDECDAIVATTSKALIGRFLDPSMGHSFAGVTVHRPLADVSGLSESAVPEVLPPLHPPFRDPTRNEPQTRF